MVISEALRKEYLEKFNNDGFLTAEIYSDSEMNSIRNFALNWVFKLLEKYNSKALVGSIDTYHLWLGETNINHSKVLSAKNRHTNPNNFLRSKIINDKLMKLLMALEPAKAIKLWDEGLGWLAFRLIRPGFNDGYPWSCKSWGPAKNCLSIWIPISGCGSEETVALWKGSHKKTHNKFLPTNSKFTKDEFRLVDEPEIKEVVRPNLKDNQLIIFGPNTIHSEDVKVGKYTRLNLEFRFEVLDKNKE